MAKIKPHDKFYGIFWIDKKLATINLVPGKKVYGEELIKIKGIEYRIWNHYRSKPAAAIKKDFKEFPIKKGMKILYLGAASGTTVSHFSDIIGKDGVIYAVEISPRSMRDLTSVAEKRGNIVCILADARKPESYSWVEQVDLVYCDVADIQEVDIFIRNYNEFLKKNGYGMIAIKSQSIDVTKPPKQIYKIEIEKLKKSNFEIIDFKELEPFEKDHGFVLVRKP